MIFDFEMFKKALAEYFLPLKQMVMENKKDVLKKELKEKERELKLNQENQKYLNKILLLMSHVDGENDEDIYLKYQEVITEFTCWLDHVNAIRKGSDKDILLSMRSALDNWTNDQLESTELNINRLHKEIQDIKDDLSDEHSPE